MSVNLTTAFIFTTKNMLRRCRYLAMLHLHVTEIVFVVSEGGLTLRAGPLRLVSPCRGGLTSRCLIIFIVVIFILIILLLFLFPAPVFTVRVVRFPRRLWLDSRRTRGVTWCRRGVSGVRLNFLFGWRTSVSSLRKEGELVAVVNYTNTTDNITFTSEIKCSWDRT